MEFDDPEKSPSREAEGLEQDDKASVHSIPNDDTEFGGTEARRKLERQLLWKLDVRMSILVVIYILNYVSRVPCAFIQSPLIMV